MLTEYDLELDGELHPMLVKENEFMHDGILDSPKEIVDVLNEFLHLSHKAEEYLVLLVVNTKGMPLGLFKVAKGTVNQCVANPREVMIRVLICGGSHFFLIHNHPSGSVIPSYEDMRVMHSMKNAGEMIGIPLQDYLIVGGKNFWSSQEVLASKS